MKNKMAVNTKGKMSFGAGGGWGGLRRVRFAGVCVFIDVSLFPEWWGREESCRALDGDLQSVQIVAQLDRGGT